MPSITNANNLFFIIPLSEFLRIAGSTLLLEDFLSVTLNLIDRMINQGCPKHMLLKHIKKAFNRHPEAFHKYHKYHIIASDIVSSIAVNKYKK